MVSGGKKVAIGVLSLVMAVLFWPIALICLGGVLVWKCKEQIARSAENSY